jgi:hypothetical protein
MSHAEQLVEIATELAMEVKLKLQHFSGVWLNWRTVRLKWKLASTRRSLRFSA